jgi:hypothetical protein
MPNMSMATDLENNAEEICQKLDKLNGPPQWPTKWPTMSEEEIRHGLDTHAISDLLKSSVAEGSLEEGERERNENGEVARLRDEISALGKKLSDKATEATRLRGEICTLGKKLSDKATTLRVTRIGLFIAAAGLAIDLLFR